MPEQVAYVAFTGKAAEVLREKGNPNATTAHKLLYHSKQLPSGQFVYKPKSSLGDYQLIVVDEISMLPRDMWELLLKHKVHVIACGDPFQIPPIDKNQDNNVLESPHIFLDEIVRQAKESDIICLSMDIRENKRLKPMKGNDIQIFRKPEISDGMCRWADQIIVGTNRIRGILNDCMRRINQKGSEPEPNDKIICLRNCWETMSTVELNPLINGSVGFISQGEVKPFYYYMDGRKFEVPLLVADIKVLNDSYLEVPIDYTALTTGKKFFNPREEYLIRKNKKNPPLPIEFNYGYAITAHRAQGSQWNKVLVVEESFPFDKEEHARWLYTACTRASDKLTLILK